MIRYAFNAVRKGIVAVRGALRGMSDGNDAVGNGLGAIVSADGVGQFCARTAKQKLVPLSAVSHNSVIAQ